MKQFPMTGIVPPQSVHTKQLPGGNSDPLPQSFNKKKGSANGGDLRPIGYQPKQKWGSM